MTSPAHNKPSQRGEQAFAQNVKGGYPTTRMRRLRSSGWMREMIAETRLGVSDLIYPLFVIEGENESQAIESLSGIERQTIDLIAETAKKAADMGIPALALFPCVENTKKSDDGEEATNPFNLVCRTIQAIKKEVPNIGIITDVALDPYTTHGHDGLLEGDKILNDKTVGILCKQALNQAKAGADIIAPSDMMDGRIGAIRQTLDANGFEDVAIMAYAAKYASCFYGPFRDAVGSKGVLKGDKKTYQMNPANADEALREVALDLEEGADMVMVKPGMPYLDIVNRVKSTFLAPTFAYQVSGEYAMLKAAADLGHLNYQDALMESLLAFKRAGCDGILTYGALDAAKDLLQKKRA